MRPSDLGVVISVRAELRSGGARKIRERLDITAAEMGRAVGVSRTTIGDWEAGRKRPTDLHALAYGRALAAAERKAA